MTTLTLTPDVALGRVRVIYTDAAGATLTRDGETVRAGEALTGSGVLDDYEAPLGVPLTYQLGAASATVTLDITTSWLSHPFDASLRMPLAAVETDDGRQWNAPGAAHYPIGASLPIVVWGPRNDYRGTLLVHTAPDRSDDMRALLLSGSPLLLRTPVGCPVDDRWLWPETVTRSRLGPPSAPLRWRFTLTYVECEPPLGSPPPDPSNPWSGVPVEHATWFDVVAAHASWLDLVQTPHPHPAP